MGYEEQVNSMRMIGYLITWYTAISLVLILNTTTPIACSHITFQSRNFILIVQNTTKGRVSVVGVCVPYSHIFVIFLDIVNNT